VRTFLRLSVYDDIIEMQQLTTEVAQCSYITQYSQIITKTKTQYNV